MQLETTKVETMLLETPLLETMLLETMQEETTQVVIKLVETTLVTLYFMYEGVDDAQEAEFPEIVSQIV